MFIAGITGYKNISNFQEKLSFGKNNNLKTNCFTTLDNLPNLYNQLNLVQKELADKKKLKQKRDSLIASEKASNNLLTSEVLKASCENLYHDDIIEFLNEETLRLKNRIAALENAKNRNDII